MAREMLCRLHLRRGIHRKAGGFTLLEMLITVTLMVTIIAVAAPSFSSYIDSNKVKQLATEMEWVLVQAKSEAVMRNTKLKVHFVRDDTNETVYQTDGAWVLAVTDEAATVNSIASAKAAAIALVDGKDFKHVAIKSSRTFVEQTIDPVRATTNKLGNFSFYKESGKDLKVIMSQRTGRIRTCGISGDYYNYERCS